MFTISVFPDQVINIAKGAFFFSYRAQGTRACLTVAFLRPTHWCLLPPPTFLSQIVNAF